MYNVRRSGATRVIARGFPRFKITMISFPSILCTTEKKLHDNYLSKTFEMRLIYVKDSQIYMLRVDCRCTENAINGWSGHLWNLQVYLWYGYVEYRFLIFVLSKVISKFILVFTRVLLSTILNIIYHTLYIIVLIFRY